MTAVCRPVGDSCHEALTCGEVYNQSFSVNNWQQSLACNRRNGRLYCEANTWLPNVHYLSYLHVLSRPPLRTTPFTCRELRTHRQTNTASPFRGISSFPIVHRGSSTPPIGRVGHCSDAVSSRAVTSCSTTAAKTYRSPNIEIKLKLEGWCKWHRASHSTWELHIGYSDRVATGGVEREYESLFSSIHRCGPRSAVRFTRHSLTFAITFRHMTRLFGCAASLVSATVNRSVVPINQREEQYEEGK